MHDRFDDEVTEKAGAGKDVLQQLEELTHHLGELYQRLSTDRDSWAVTGGDLAQTVEELQKQIKGFSSVEEKFKQQLASFIKQETRQAADNVVGSMEKEIKPLLGRFSTTLLDTKRLLTSYEWAMKKSSGIWANVLTPLLAAMTGGVIAAILVYFLIGGFDNARRVTQAITTPSAAVQQSGQYVHKKIKASMQEDEGR